eukprot:6215368-Prymnesium_polylepis.1
MDALVPAAKSGRGSSRPCCVVKAEIIDPEDARIIHERRVGAHAPKGVALFGLHIGQRPSEGNIVRDARLREVEAVAIRK